MAFTKLEFTKDWTESNPESSAYFPTVEYTEEQVRADMQLLHDETKTAFNNLVDDLNGGEGASDLSIEPIDDREATTVQGALEEIDTDVKANNAARHTHSNKTLLDTYTQSNTDLGNAVLYTHTHDNKTVLDAIIASVKEGYDRLVSMFTNITSVTDTIVGASNSSIPTSLAVANYISDTGNGDMLKAFYDTTNTGDKVDTALNAEKLGGELPSYYAKASDVPEDKVFIATVGTTTYAEITAALNAGKTVFARASSGKVYLYAISGAAGYMFCSVSSSTNQHAHHVYWVNSSNTWSASTYYFPSIDISGSYDKLSARLGTNATAQQTLSNAQLRDITISSTDISEGDPLATGTFYVVYEP